MTQGPINPKETAQAAIRAGLLTPAERIGAVIEQADANWKQNHMGDLRTPEEAGISAVVPPPPKPRHQYKKTTPKKDKYCLRERDLINMGFSRREIQELKNEVRKL